jgi:hypothetical protein
VRKNVAGEYQIEVEHAGERTIILPNAILKFGYVDKNAEDKFFIEYRVH